MNKQILFALCLVPALLAEPPRVIQTDPPSWWIGSSLNPIRVLIRGSGLHNAKLQAPAGMAVRNLKTSDRGTYLFADLDLSKTRKPGATTLKVITSQGSAEARFEVLPPLDRTARFQGFSPADVIYLVMPDRFANGDPSNDDPASAKGLFDRSKRRYYHGGDLQGVIDKLPYLKSLGVTALWLNPWYDNNDRMNEIERYDGEAITDYHGYGATDFYGVEQHFGDLPKLREMVEAARKLGIKVIQDQVANHTGPYHPWAQDPPTPDWFNGSPAAHLNNDWQYWTQMDPNATTEVRRASLDGWFVNILPDLNQNNPETRRYLIQNALWWVGVLGLDGIRQDTLPYAPRGFWAEWRTALAREFPRLNVVGEVLDGDPHVVSFYQGGSIRFDGIDSRIESLFDFPLMYALRKVFGEGRDAREIARTLAKDPLYIDPSRLVTLAGLHDVKRFLHEPGADRIGLGLAFTFLFTARGIPMIYYGDEIGMPGGEDPENRRDFPGGWAGDPRNAFAESGRAREEQQLFAHLQRLAKLRRESPALQQGSTVLLHASESALVYGRKLGEERVIAAFNNSRSLATLDISASGAGVREGARLTARLGAASLTAADGRLRIVLPPRSAEVYTLNPH
ncbi:MAG: cyclomaltodextrinase N-terminal domain-containing protein [Bryobacteraceae bacterium]|nr:cyclomaltodextrinase N-terminal domain-containing protein [Bryobacteraceae bacterium]